PEGRAVFGRRRILRADDGVLRLAEQQRVRGVMERSQHACDIAQRAALDAALAQRPGRLAFEIDDDEVVASLQNLPEVVVAMNADAKTAHPAIENPPRAFLQLLFPLQQLVGGRISL